MRKFLALVSNLILTITYAQQGDFLLTHHFPSNSNLDNTNFEIISDNNGLLCVANRSGVLKYDGDTWDFYETPSAALSLAVDSTNTIYVGGIGSIGQISLNRNSIEFNQLIVNDSLNDLFFQTVHHRGKVYFLGNHHLITYQINEGKSEIIKGNFENLFKIEDRIYLNTNEETLHIQEDTLEIIDLGLKVSSASNYKTKPTLLVDNEGVLFVWDKRAKSIGHNKLIAENGYDIIEAKWVNDSLIACSTYANGIIFLNYNDLKYLEVTDYHSGLPDNEIYALHADRTAGVWIAHPFGITSVSPLFPAFSYSNFPGLEGNLTGIYQKKDGLWVSSSHGLFYFDRDTIFKSQVYYTRVAKKTTKPIPQQKPVARANKKKKQFLGGLLKKKNKVPSTSENEKKGFLKSIAKGVEDLFDHPDNLEKVNAKQARSGRYQRRVRKIPVKVNYQFTQVEGTDGKFSDLITFDDLLLGIGNTGVYEVSKVESHRVINESIRTATMTNSGQLVVNTADLQLKTFKLIDDIWIELTSQPIEDIIVNIYEDQRGKVWLAGSSRLYNIALTDSTLSVTNSYEIDNQSLDDLDIIERNNTLYFINSHGYYYYDPQLDIILEDKELKSQIGLATFSLSEPSKEAVWINNGKNWWRIPSEGPVRQYDGINLFNNLVSISKDIRSSEYWLLTRDNQLFKYNEEKRKSLDTYQLFVKKLSNQKGAIDKSKRFSLAYDENFLTVELSKPDYMGLLNPEFQYRLNGLHTEWSEWTTSKSIDFSYLPPGQYSLSVRSKDSFGRIEEVSMLDFRVRSPYWQRPWFYALQIIFFGALVVVSSRMNQSKTQNRLISGGLSVLTLILIIEFIQSAAGSFLNIQSTPVVDFLIDVFVALLIFPLETFLRQFLSKGKVEVPIADSSLGKKLKSKRTK